MVDIHQKIRQQFIVLNFFSLYIKTTSSGFRSRDRQFSGTISLELLRFQKENSIAVTELQIQSDHCRSQEKFQLWWRKLTWSGNLTTPDYLVLGH